MFLSGFGSFTIIGKDTLVPCKVDAGSVEKDTLVSGEVCSAAVLEGLRAKNNRWISE